MFSSSIHSSSNVGPKKFQSARLGTNEYGIPNLMSLELNFTKDKVPEMLYHPMEQDRKEAKPFRSNLSNSLTVIEHNVLQMNGWLGLGRGIRHGGLDELGTL